MSWEDVSLQDLPQALSAQQVVGKPQLVVEDKLGEPACESDMRQISEDNLITVMWKHFSRRKQRVALMIIFIWAIFAIILTSATHANTRTVSRHVNSFEQKAVDVFEHRDEDSVLHHWDWNLTLLGGSMMVVLWLVWVVVRLFVVVLLPYLGWVCIAFACKRVASYTHHRAIVEAGANSSIKDLNDDEDPDLAIFGPEGVLQAGCMSKYLKGQFTKHVVMTIKCRGLLERNAANTLMITRLARDAFRERGMRPTHQAQMLPIVIELVYLPLQADIEAAEMAETYMFAQQRLNFSRASTLNGIIDWVRLPWWTDRRITQSRF
jgi:hypothetical protein